MNVLDLTLLAIIVGLGYAGFRQGFVVGVASLVGFTAGMFGATRLAQHLGGGATSSPYAGIWGVSCALALAIVFAAAMEGFGTRIRDRLHLVGGALVDRTLGAVLAMSLACVAIWASAAIIMGIPQLTKSRNVILQSEIVRAINGPLPPAEGLLNLLSRYDPLPTINGPRITVDPPDVTTIVDPQVRRAADSVVRVVGSACGFSITGSGWVIGPNLVVTNAHVVAGERDTAIRMRGSSGDFPAAVWLFDPVQDLAILHVPRLHRSPLVMADKVAPSTNAAVLGFPENGPFDARPARIGEIRPVRAPDIYGGDETVRNVVSFRGLVRHGNSGGPVVDANGHVLTTVFASTVGNVVRGGYGVTNEDVALSLSRIDRLPVSTGGCTAE